MFDRFIHLEAIKSQCIRNLAGMQKFSGLFYRTMHSSFICISTKEWTKKRIGLYKEVLTRQVKSSLDYMMTYTYKYVHSLFLAIIFGTHGNKWTESCPIINSLYMNQNRCSKKLPFIWMQLIFSQNLFNFVPLPWKLKFHKVLSYLKKW